MVRLFGKIHQVPPTVEIAEKFNLKKKSDSLSGTQMSNSVNSGMLTSFLNVDDVLGLIAAFRFQSTGNV